MKAYKAADITGEAPRWTWIFNPTFNHRTGTLRTKAVQHHAEPVKVLPNFSFLFHGCLPGRAKREIKGPVPNFQLVAEMQDQSGTNSFQHEVGAIEPRAFGPTLRAANRNHRAGPNPTGAERKTFRRSPLQDRNNDHPIFLPVQGENTRAPDPGWEDFASAAPAPYLRCPEPHTPW